MFSNLFDIIRIELECIEKAAGQRIEEGDLRNGDMGQAVKR
jgi:hypothetical protein